MRALLLLPCLPLCLAVITSQGPWGARHDSGIEVREEFTGWLAGGEGDYVMTLAQANARKHAASSNSVNLLSAGGRGGYGPGGAASLLNLTYYQSNDTVLPSTLHTHKRFIT